MSNSDYIPSTKPIHRTPIKLIKRPLRAMPLGAVKYLRDYLHRTTSDYLAELPEPIPSALRELVRLASREVLAKETENLKP